MSVEYSLDTFNINVDNDFADDTLSIIESDDNFQMIDAVDTILAIENPDDIQPILVEET